MSNATRHLTYLTNPLPHHTLILSLSTPHPADCSSAPQILNLYIYSYARLAADYEEEGYNWVLFVQVYTEVSLKNLCRVLKRFDHSKPYFLGRALEDTGRVVIHHYDETGFKYPDAVAGILVTWSAVSRPHGRPRINFSIDVMYEVNFQHSLCHSPHLLYNGISM